MPLADNRVVLKFLDVSMAPGDALELLDGPERTVFMASPEVPVDSMIFSRYTLSVLKGQSLRDTRQNRGHTLAKL